MKVVGNKAVISFENVGSGLEARGDSLTGFTIASADRKFQNAIATIEGNTVVVELPTGQEPVAVRFGWSNFPVVNLWNKNGLPAVPFRTDSFKGITERE
jgi:sialate O-acetylesterase